MVSSVPWVENSRYAAHLDLAGSEIAVFLGSFRPGTRVAALSLLGCHRGGLTGENSTPRHVFLGTTTWQPQSVEKQRSEKRSIATTYTQKGLMICKAPGPCGRMNAFQRLMYQWTGLHPYNAVHTYKIAGPLRLEKLREAIRDASWHNGLGMVHVAPDGLSYRHEADGDAEIQVLPGGQDPESRLGEHVARELNRPFDRPVCRPWRFSVIDAGPVARYVSATYDHWVADSVAARLLVRHILGSYCGLGLAENRQPLELYPETYREAFGRRLHGVRLAMAVARSVRRWRRERSAWQASYSSATHMAVDYQLLSTAPGTVGQLREFAHELGATVHDVLLAALARALGEFLPGGLHEAEAASCRWAASSIRGPTPGGT